MTEPQKEPLHMDMNVCLQHNTLVAHMFSLLGFECRIFFFTSQFLFFFETQTQTNDEEDARSKSRSLDFWGHIMS